MLHMNKVYITEFVQFVNNVSKYYRVP